MAHGMVSLARITVIPWRFIGTAAETAAALFVKPVDRVQQEMAPVGHMGEILWERCYG